MKKKIVGILAAAVIGTTAFATAASAASGTINVISREDGSGTRGAFIELFGIQEEKDGEKVDMTTEDASITNSTSVMMTTVAGDENAIGYISLGSLNESSSSFPPSPASAWAPRRPTSWPPTWARPSSFTSTRWTPSTPISIR